MNWGSRGPRARARTVSVVIASALGVASCVGTGAIVKIETNPEGAEASLESGASCITPCTLRMRDTTRISITKIGYKTRVVDLKPSPVNLGTKLSYDLVLISASKPVEESGLPDVEVDDEIPDREQPAPTGNALVMVPIGPRSSPPTPSLAQEAEASVEETEVEPMDAETPND